MVQLLHRSRTKHVGVDRFNENIDVINGQLKQLGCNAVTLHVYTFTTSFT